MKIDNKIISDIALQKYPIDKQEIRNNLCFYEIDTNCVIRKGYEEGYSDALKTVSDTQIDSNLYVLVFSKMEIIEDHEGWIPTPCKVQCISKSEDICRGHIYELISHDEKLELNPEYCYDTIDNEGYKHDEAYICTNKNGSVFKYYYDIDCNNVI